MELSGLPALEVGESGLVLAHFAVKRGQFETFVNEIREAAAKLQALSSDVAWVLGESDILLQIGLKDFRVVRELQSSLSLFGLPGSTWIYSIPYASFGSTPLGDGASRYVVYLRVNRSLYRALGVTAEKYVRARLENLLRSFEGVSGALHVCLGSPDLALVGSFSCSMQVWLTFIGAIRALAVPQLSVELFTASFSLVGFPWDERTAGIVPENLAEPSPVSAILAKVSPVFLKKLEEVGGAIESLLPDSGVESYYFLEGRYDLLIVLKPHQGPLNLYNTLEALKDMGSGKTETHFLVSNVKEISRGLTRAREADATDIEIDHDLTVGSCTCSQDARLIAVAQQSVDLLPSGLYVDVQTVLALMRSSLIEPTNCCDAKRAIQACRNGLVILLMLLERCHKRLARSLKKKKSKKEQSLSHGHVRLYEQGITRWCTYAERVLRERAADSVDDLFRERKTLPETRGSLRKLLFLADNLLEEFYLGFAPKVRDGILDLRPLFATVYEPIGTIMSERSSGIVRIPSRYAFSLHLVLPQLWHEVGQFVFQNKYGQPFSVATNEILENTKGTVKGERRSEEKSGSVPIDTGKFLFEAADLYSDLIVLHYGFHDNYELFFKYLTTLFFETWLYEEYPPVEQEIGLEFLVRRLYIAAHFHCLLHVLWAQGKEASDCQEELEKASKDFRARADNLYALVDKIGTLYGTSRYKTDQSHRFLLAGMDRGRKKRIAEQAVGSLKEGIYSQFEGYMLALLVELGVSSRYVADGAVSRVWDEVQRGRVVDLGTVRANDLYLNLYKADLERLLCTPHGESPEPNFRTMAALGRTCTLAFYQRSGAF